ncbi:MAG: fused MFS/spermidine synthase [Lachnospiraceae bacterium]|nr:fused MFS/spermidine synthase [Lachnospiraceae bacterium]
MDILRRKTDKTPGKVFFTADDQYGKYVVRNGTYRGKEARLYEVDDVRESASFFDEEKYELVFDYAKSFTLLFKEVPEMKNMLMLGGAGFQFPKYVISHYPDTAMDVVEINPLAVRLARKYFFLNDLEKEFRAESKGRLNIIVDDGMEYLKDTTKKYDIIINDAYHSNLPDKGLTSPEGTLLIKEHLAPGGVYGFNLITSLEGQDSMPLVMMSSIFSYHFENVKYVICSPDVKPDVVQNILFVCH